MGLKKKLGRTLLCLLLVLSMVFVHPALLTAANAEEERTYGGIEIEKDAYWCVEGSMAIMNVILDVPPRFPNALRAALLVSSNDSTGVQGYSIDTPCSGSARLAIYGLKAGVYTVSVETLYSNEVYSDTCTVTVLPVEASSVSLNKTALSMVAGDKVSLSATVSPANTTDKSITWTSGNTSVATVDANGQVTAKAAGTTTITATTTNGKTATCTVTVYHQTRTANLIAGGTVWLGKPNEVAGGDQLRVKNNGTGSAGYYTREAYAKFYIAGMEAYAENNGLEIESVYLKFSTASSGQISANRTVYVHEVNSNSWKESTLKYSNAPAIGQQIGSAVINGNTEYGTNYAEKSIDVTDYILSKMESGDAASVAFTVSTCGGESIMIPKANVRLVAVYKMAD